MAVDDDGGDFRGVVNILERVFFQQDKIGELSAFHAAQILFPVKENGGVERGGLQGFERSEAGVDKALQLFVKAEAGKNVNAGRRIGSGEKWNTGFVKELDDFELLFDELLASGEIVGVEFGLHLFDEIFPGFILPFDGNVFGARVFGEVGEIDEITATFPDQRGALPGLIFGEQLREGRRASWIVGSEKFCFVFAAREEFVFEGRAAFKDADKVLEAVHAGVGHFAGTDGVGNVTFKGDVLFFGFFGDGEDGVARDEGLQLDEVRAALLEVVDGFAGVFGRGDGDGAGETGLGAVEHGAGGDNARAGEFAVFNLVAPFLDDGEFAAHVANASDAVGDEQRERNPLRSGKPVAEDEVDVHIPEPWDEIAAASAGGGRIARVTHGFAWTDVADAVFFDDYDLTGKDGAGADVNDVDVGKDECVLERPILGASWSDVGKEKTENGKEDGEGTEFHERYFRRKGARVGRDSRPVFREAKKAAQRSSGLAVREEGPPYPLFVVSAEMVGITEVSRMCGKEWS